MGDDLLSRKSMNDHGFFGSLAFCNLIIMLLISPISRRTFFEQAMKPIARRWNIHVVAVIIAICYYSEPIKSLIRASPSASLTHVPFY